MGLGNGWSSSAGVPRGCSWTLLLVGVLAAMRGATVVLCLRAARRHGVVMGRTQPVPSAPAPPFTPLCSECL